MAVQWQQYEKIVSFEVRRSGAVYGFEEEDVKQEMRLVAIRCAATVVGNSGRAYVRKSIRNALVNLKNSADRRAPKDARGRPYKPTRINADRSISKSVLALSVKGPLPDSQAETNELISVLNELSSEDKFLLYSAFVDNVKYRRSDRVEEVRERAERLLTEFINRKRRTTMAAPQKSLLGPEVPSCHVYGTNPLGYETSLLEEDATSRVLCQDCLDKFSCLMDGLKSGVVKDANLSVDSEVKAYARGLIPISVLRERVLQRLRLREVNKDIPANLAYDIIPEIQAKLDKLSNEVSDLVGNKKPEEDKTMFPDADLDDEETEIEDEETETEEEDEMEEEEVKPKAKKAKPVKAKLAKNDKPVKAKKVKPVVEDDDDEEEEEAPVAAEEDDEEEAPKPKKKAAKVKPAKKVAKAVEKPKPVTVKKAKKAAAEEEEESDEDLAEMSRVKPAKASKASKSTKAVKAVKEEKPKGKRGRPAKEGSSSIKTTGPKHRLGEKGFFRHPGKPKKQEDGSIKLPNGRKILGPRPLTPERMGLELAKLNKLLGLPFDLELGMTLIQERRKHSPIEIKLTKTGFKFEDQIYSSLSTACMQSVNRFVSGPEMFAFAKHNNISVRGKAVPNGLYRRATDLSAGADE